MNLASSSAVRWSRRVVCTTAFLCTLGGTILPRTAGAHRWHPNAYQVIKAVNEEAKTVTIGTEHNKDHTEKALKVTAFTEVTVDGQKATLHDLKPGMRVEVDLNSDDEAKGLTAFHMNKN